MYFKSIQQLRGKLFQETILIYKYQLYSNLKNKLIPVLINFSKN